MLPADNQGPVLTRLSTFALPTVPSIEDGQPPLPVPNSIRGLAFLSQLAVYKDLIPGYRIRELTAMEEAEKVRDEVRRLREGEKMLVRSYKGYLKLLEHEIKRESLMSQQLGSKLICRSDAFGQSELEVYGGFARLRYALQL